MCIAFLFPFKDHPCTPTQDHGQQKFNERKQRRENYNTENAQPTPKQGDMESAIICPSIPIINQDINCLFLRKIIIKRDQCIK